MRRPFLQRPFFSENSEISKPLLKSCEATRCRQALDQTPITFVIPLTGRSSALHRFLKNFENLAKNQKEAINLVIVDFPDGAKEDTKQLKSDLYALEHSLPDSRIELIQESGEFSRGKGLQVGGVSQGKDELLFFCDIDMVFDSSTLRRIRYETVQVTGLRNTSL